MGKEGGWLPSPDFLLAKKSMFFMDLLFLLKTDFPS